MKQENTSIQENSNYKKPSYEDLEKLVNQLASQNRFFKESLQKAFEENTHKIIGHLYKVIDTMNWENPPYTKIFYNKCVKKITELLTPFLQDDKAKNSESTDNK